MSTPVNCSFLPSSGGLNSLWSCAPIKTCWKRFPAVPFHLFRPGYGRAWRSSWRQSTRDHEPDSLVEEVLASFWGASKRPRRRARTVQSTLWNERDTYVITYGNSLVDGEHKPLDILYDFLCRYLSGTIIGVHILPFFPFTSDDGFAVTDYRAVNSSLGDWGRRSEDLGRLPPYVGSRHQSRIQPERVVQCLSSGAFAL